ncbi:MAG: VanZ family protein [Deltaproteobacteria bacterium]|nr:VanZ family protein [Deltaproteobacteria bacterium]
MPLTRRKAWGFVGAYVALVYAGLYFTPFLGLYLSKRNALGSFVGWTYALSALFLIYFLYFKLKIRKAEAYGLLLGLGILFQGAIQRMEETLDRLHFLEYGLLYLLIYLAFRFSSDGIVLIGRTIILCSLFALGDEGLQGLLPNRMAEWHDVLINISACYLAAGVVFVACKYRDLHDGKRR